MEFRVRTTKTLYEDADVIKKLSGLGFTFNPAGVAGAFFINDEVKLELNDLSQLTSLASEIGPLILHDQDEIEIYNGYRE